MRDFKAATYSPLSKRREGRGGGGKGPADCKIKGGNKCEKTTGTRKHKPIFAGNKGTWTPLGDAQNNPQTCLTHLTASSLKAKHTSAQSQRPVCFCEIRRSSPLNRIYFHRFSHTDWALVFHPSLVDRWWFEVFSTQFIDCFSAV